MKRLSLSLLAYDTISEGLEDAVAAACGEAEISHEVTKRPSLEGLREACRQWAFLPEILVVELPAGADPVGSVESLVADLPPGETEIALINVPNDIDIYRKFKQMGVREVFPGYPDTEQILELIEDIRSSMMGRVGIDPRKAVYVFSACGGAGGTSLATSFSRHFARQGKRTLHIDLDIATGPASFMFNAERGARETSGLLEALANPARVDAIFLDRAIEVADRNLFYLSARRRSSDPEPSAEAIPSIIARAQQNFDMVVIDVPWRCFPEPDLMSVQGHCYIVSTPSPAGLLGFNVIAHDLEAAPARNPIYGVINRQGEFKPNDIDKSSFQETANIEIFAIPYDASSAGRMFFDQKTYLDLGGKVQSAALKIVQSLPGETEGNAPNKSKKTSAGLLGLFGKSAPRKKKPPVRKKKSKT